MNMIPSIDEIVNNDLLIKDMDLTNDEVSVLLLLTEVSKMDDVNELRETFISILDNQLDIKSCHNIIDKMRNYFTQNIRKNITGNEILDRMPLISVNYDISYKNFVCIIGI